MGISRWAKVARWTPAVALGGVGIWIASYRWWRNWCLHWGARPEEVGAVYPGDEFRSDPDIVSTRAITIDATPGEIWPWLVQMGPGRGGAYTYDWIENLFGLDMHSADRIVPEWQDLALGDAWQLGAKGPTLRVVVLVADQALVVRSDDGNWVWAFVLEPESWERGPTRLVSRNRISLPAEASAAARRVATYVMEPGSLIMERKMLLGIRSRASTHRAS